MYSRVGESSSFGFDGTPPITNGIHAGDESVTQRETNNANQEVHAFLSLVPPQNCFIVVVTSRSVANGFGMVTSIVGNSICYPSPAVLVPKAVMCYDDLQL